MMTVLAAVASAAMLWACGVASVMTPEPTVATRADIIGTWSQTITAGTSQAHGANLPDYTLTMELRDDGIFVQTINATVAGISAHTTGRWRRSGEHILLDGLLMEGGSGNAPWHKTNTAWWMTKSELPGQQLSLYGGLWTDADVWVQFSRVSATCSSGNRREQRNNNRCQANSSDNDEQEE